MDKAPSQIVRQLLLDAGLDWPISYDSEMDTPDDVVTVYDTQETIDSDGMQSQDRHYGLQVRIRAKDSNTGRIKAEWIRDFLNTVLAQSVTVDAETFIVRAISTSTLLRIGKDGATTRRSLFVINCKASIDPVEEGTIDVDDSGGLLLWD